MIIDATIAKALVSIIFMSTQGDLTQQLPLQVVDRGESWLVKGTPYTDKHIDSQYIASFVFIKKASAEVIGLGSDARMIPTEAEKKEWSRTMTPAQYAAIFGPRTRFEPGGSSFKINMAMYKALYGGLINKPDDAVAYAHVLMQSSPGLAQVPARDLRAEEQEGVWHVTQIAPDHKQVEVMRFSRENGRVLSGDL